MIYHFALEDDKEEKKKVFRKLYERNTGRGMTEQGALNDLADTFEMRVSDVQQLLRGQSVGNNDDTF